VESLFEGPLCGIPLGKHSTGQAEDTRQNGKNSETVMAGKENIEDSRRRLRLPASLALRSEDSAMLD